MVSKTKEEAMIETYIYFAEPIDIHTLRSILGSKLAESPRDTLVYLDDYVRVEIQYPESGLPLVDHDVRSDDGRYLEEVGCWGRLSVLAWDSPAKTAETNALLPLMWLAPYLIDLDVEFKWLDPFSMEVNWGFDLFDVMRYFDAAERAI